MTTPMRTSSSKRATNITLSLDVYNEAKAMGINISQACERSLREAIREEKAKAWADEHADFIAAYNALIDQEGPALAEWRSF